MLSVVMRLRGAGRAYRGLCWLLTRVYYPRVRFPGDARLNGIPIVTCVSGSTIQVGRRFVAASHSAFNAVGVSHPCVLRTLSSAARIVIGDDVGMSGASVVCVSSITIGDRCMLGADVILSDSDLHALDESQPRYVKTYGPSRPIVLGDDVFVGARSIVLKGVSIGPGAVVGAGSVVTHDVAPGHIVAGCPARPVGRREGRE